MNPYFQQILDQFKGDIKFKELRGKLALSPDEFIYMIETDHGIYYVFETDFIDNFDYIIQQVKERTEGFSNFVEAKFPLEKFEETPSAKY